MLAQRRKMFKTRERAAEAARLREKYDASFRWVWLALLSSLTSGIGNYIMGIKLVKAGPFGPGFTGALGLAMLVVLRVGEALKNKKTIGTFINY